ncbi:Outer envelope pore protein 16-2, chloroplastic [Quillaja saponaria]|uniref:Outer envelope pore protein 16-2, chloroplastic n=1 Tax=Quillaja saponaria TaxID=32244 RepID=A0AAD7LCI5_QUISA|nr:Outer envelope pore protein 16-2, chloroplastic [Quillaja saponaria]
MNTSASNLDERSMLGELRSFREGGFFDLGHPLLNCIAESFVKAAGIGALQAGSREAYFIAIEGAGLDSNGGIPPEISSAKKHQFPGLKGETNRNSLEAMVKNTGKESLQWVWRIGESRDKFLHIAGLAAGIYSGLTYGLKEACGAHDWKNSAVAGAITGVALAVTSEHSSHEQIVQCAITGAALSTAANLLTGIF